MYPPPLTVESLFTPQLAMLPGQDVGASTRSLHADDILNVVPDVTPPIHVATTFRYPDDPEKLTPAAELTGGYEDNKTSHVYSRLSAPNFTRFETILSALLNGEAISYSSGLSAFHAALVLLNPRRISIGNGYHGCHGVIDLFTRLTGLQKLDLNCPAEQLEAGDVIHLETPVNPEGTSFKIEEYAKKAHSRGAYLIVDATFAPPPLQDPFKWGADLVMHSGSKYFGGHGDVLCGVLATQNKEWSRQLFKDRVFLGSVMGNMEGWLGTRSLRTLEVRVQRLSQNATNLVSWLHNALQTQNPSADSDEDVTQKALKEVFHSSLQKSDESWLLKQMPNGFGPVFSITMNEEEYARKLPSKLALFQHATSLGGVESLIEWRTMSDTTVDRRLLRVSVGLENWEDLRNDMVNAFRALVKG
ncbi:pyridoxal phosphate-dependent transferase [Aspergillus karnatakaensis]|uniref:cystathionine gamma-synthase n=1 Tax=Aspergillus karnatakaensis TaxID=1810916 RepID=UPI003CCDF73A